MISATVRDEIDEHGQRWAVITISFFGDSFEVREPIDRPLDEDEIAAFNSPQVPQNPPLPPLPH